MSRCVTHFTTLCVVALILGYLVVYAEYFVPKGMSNWDACVVDRFSEGYLTPDSHKSSKMLMFLTEVFVFLVCGQLILWQFPPQEGVEVRQRTFSHFLNYSAAFDFCYVALWFVTTYMLVIFLKDAIADTTCNNKPNR